MFRKTLYALTTLLLLSVPAFAQQVKVPMEHRVFNPTDRRCVWCSLELLGYTNKIDRLKGLSHQYEGPVYTWDTIYWVLNDRKIKFKANPAGNKTDEAIIEFLMKPCREGRGAAIGVNWGRHMLNIVDYDTKQETVSIIDNSDPKLLVRTIQWQSFYQWWDGSALVIFPDK